MPRHIQPSFDIDQKCDAVRRVPGGENANRIAAELQIAFSPEDATPSLAGFVPIGAFARWNTALPWTGLLVILLLAVYSATRFLQP